MKSNSPVAAEKSKTSASSALDFGDLDEMVGIMVQRSFHIATRYFREYMGKDFKPGYYTSLSLIEKNPDLTQKSLAIAIGRDASTLVPFLDKMEGNGFVVRKRNAKDRRAHGLYLTKLGHATAKRYDDKVRALEANIAKKMGTKDARQLKSLLAKFDGIIDTL